MIPHAHRVVAALVLLLSACSVLKFAFFFVLPYPRRRAALDKAYEGRAYATATSDVVTLTLAAIISALLLASGAEPIAFLGGLFVGATLVRMFFHAFHEAPPEDREAPEPRSPLKRLSYAIQDRPARASREMAVYVVIVVAAATLNLAR